MAIDLLSVAVLPEHTNTRSSPAYAYLFQQSGSILVVGFVPTAACSRGASFDQLPCSDHHEDLFRLPSVVYLVSRTDLRRRLPPKF